MRRGGLTETGWRAGRLEASERIISSWVVPGSDCVLFKFVFWTDLIVSILAVELLMQTNGSRWEAYLG